MKYYFSGCNYSRLEDFWHYILPNYFMHSLISAFLFYHVLEMYIEDHRPSLNGLTNIELWEGWLEMQKWIENVCSLDFI